jgi:glycosyltransferase involved in cell wall biosynthesis
VSSELPGRPLRIAVLGDFESTHTRRWLRVFIERGHDVHAISYYWPAAELPGVTLHVLAGGEAPSATSGGERSGMPLVERLPRSLLRLIHGLRYRRAGLSRVLAELKPDVFHAHYAVEHGFYGALAGYHPYVLSAWGSDLYIESYKKAGRAIAGWSLRRADLVSANDPALADRAIELRMLREKVAVVRLGTDRFFLEGPTSVNLEADVAAPPTIISDRALEPLYNVDLVIRAFALVRQRLPTARLVVAHDGSQRATLEALAAEIGLRDAVTFLGRLDAVALRDALTAAHVFVSVPSTDSFAVSTFEAMAAGAFPVLSDLPSARGMIEHGSNGLLVPHGDPTSLAEALYQALTDAALRRRAAIENRKRVEADGLTEKNMLAMEQHYYRLAGVPVQATETA